MMFVDEYGILVYSFMSHGKNQSVEERETSGNDL